jgi:hypothetical protein
MKKFALVFVSLLLFVFGVSGENLKLSGRICNSEDKGNAFWFSPKGTLTWSNNDDRANGNYEASSSGLEITMDNGDVLYGTYNGNWNYSSATMSVIDANIDGGDYKSSYCR